MGRSCDVQRGLFEKPSSPFAVVIGEAANGRALPPTPRPSLCQTFCGKSLDAGSSLTGLGTRVVASTADAGSIVGGDLILSCLSLDSSAAYHQAHSWQHLVTQRSPQLHTELCRVGSRSALIHVAYLIAVQLRAASVHDRCAGTKLPLKGRLDRSKPSRLPIRGSRRLAHERVRQCRDYQT